MGTVGKSGDGAAEAQAQGSHAWGRALRGADRQVSEQTEKLESDCRSQSTSDIPSLGGTGVRIPAA